MDAYWPLSYISIITVIAGYYYRAKALAALTQRTQILIQMHFTQRPRNWHEGYARDVAQPENRKWHEGVFHAGFDPRQRHIDGAIEHHKS